MQSRLRSVIACIVTACGDDGGGNDIIEVPPLPAGFCQDWGTGGRYDDRLGANGGRAWSMLAYPDGSVVVGGEQFGGPGQLGAQYPEGNSALLRLNADGTRDAAWADNGRRVVDVSAGRNNRIYHIEVRADGGLLVGGEGYNLATTDSQADAFVEALSPTGADDASFCAGRLVVSSYFGTVRDLVAIGDRVWLAERSGGLQLHRFATCAIDRTYAAADPSPGNIDIGEHDGDAWFDSDGTAFVALVDDQDRAFLAKVSPDGGLATDFGGPSGVDLAVTGDSQRSLFEVARAPDGSTIVASVQFLPSDNVAIEVVRVLPTGTLDRTFGTDGKTILAWAGSFSDVIASPDGRIWISGGDDDPTGPEQTATLRRLTADGVLDTSFGNQGVLHTGVPDSAFHAVQALGDGRVIAAGRAGLDMFVACASP